jgi:DnaK suppressor protein
MNDLTSIRNRDLRQMLHDRRDEIHGDVKTRIRDVGTDRGTGVLDALESSDADMHEDIELALIQMKAETQVRIEEALVRLDASEYGYCFDCGGEISEMRLRALLFAVRCTACEERREQGQERTRRLAQQRGGFSLFADVAGY